MESLSVFGWEAPTHSIVDRAGTSPGQKLSEADIKISWNENKLFWEIPKCCLRNFLSSAIGFCIFLWYDRSCCGRMGTTPCWNVCVEWYKIGGGSTQREFLSNLVLPHMRNSAPEQADRQPWKHGPSVSVAWRVKFNREELKGKANPLSQPASGGWVTSEPSPSAGTGRDGLNPVWKTSSRPDELVHGIPLLVLGQLCSFIGH